MPYQITTKDNITIQNIPDDVAPDSQVLKDRVAAIRGGQLQGQAEPERIGLVEGIKEAVTGTRRKTAETEALPDWATMPELNSFSVASAATGLGTLLSNPQETVQVIQSNFPGVQVRQDDKGNFLLRSSIDGKEYAIKPGFRASDIPRAAGGVAAFTPAGRATSLLGTAAAAGATQAAIEGTQAATGGEFNPGEVATAALTAPIIPAAVRGVQAVSQPIRGAVARALGREVAVPPGIAGAVPEVAPPTTTPTVATAAETAAPLTAEELGQTARQAALGGIGSKRAISEFAGQAAPDAETVAAAERLGIAEHLQPDHVTTNQAFRQLSQLVKSQTGSEAAVVQRQGLEKVAERANAIVDEFGGTSDVSTLSAGLRERMANTQKEFLDKADNLYEEVRKKIPAKTDAPADNVLNFVKQRADNLGGSENLSPMEQMILRKLAPKENGTQPTYALLDDVRKEVGAAARQTGPFKDADTGLAKKLYEKLSSDQFAVAKNQGIADTYKAAQSAVTARKALEDDMASLFGKQLDKSMTPLVSGAVRDLGKGDASRFAKMIAAVPPEMRKEVATSGLSSFFQRTTRGGEMDFAGYARFMDGLDRNQQAKNALFSNLPEGAAQQLTDLAKVARGVAMSKGEFIATGKALNSSVLEATDSFMQRVYEAVKQRGVSGIVAEGVGTASGMPGMASAIMSATKGAKPDVLKAADKLIISPEFLQAAKAAGSKGENMAIRKLSQSQRFAQFMQQINGPRKPSDREAWARSAMIPAHQSTQRKEQRN